MKKKIDPKKSELEPENICLQTFIENVKQVSKNRVDEMTVFQFYSSWLICEMYVRWTRIRPLGGQAKLEFPSVGARSTLNFQPKLTLNY